MAALEHVTRQILALRQCFQPLVDVGGVNHNALPRVFGRVVGNIFEQLLHHGVQTARADVFGFFVDLPGNFGKAFDRARLKLKLDALGRNQRLVLARQAGVGVGEDLLEIVDRQARQFNADRKTPLQFGKTP